MHGIPDLIRLLDDPSDEDAFDRAFGPPEPLDLDDGLLPPEEARFFMTKELACDQLAELGSAAIEAIPALLRCADDMTDIIESRSMRLAAARAIWQHWRSDTLPPDLRAVTGRHRVLVSPPCCRTSRRNRPPSRSPGPPRAAGRCSSRGASGGGSGD